MLNGEILASKQGVKKNGEPFFVISTICETVSGQVIPKEFWVDEKVYSSVNTLPPRSPIKISCGLDDWGRLTPRGIQPANAAQSSGKQGQTRR